MSTTGVLCPRKGISPLIAAVLLIAFTVSIATVVASWAQSFGEERLGDASDLMGQAVDCFNINVDVQYAYLDDGQIKTLVWNGGTENFTVVRFVVFEDGVPHGFEPDGETTFRPGRHAEIVFDVDDDLDIERAELHVEPERCPRIQPVDSCEGFDGEDFIC